MTVKIIHKPQPEYKWITPSKCEENKAYIDKDGDVFICIEVMDEYILSGLDGFHYYRTQASNVLVREVNLTITVEDITE